MAVTLPHIRSLVPSTDLREVLKIAKGAFQLPWNKEDFMVAMRQRNCYGLVLEMDTDVAGYVIFELLKDRVFLLQIAVAEDYIRCGVATMLVQYLKERLDPKKRLILESDVPEDALAFQLLLQKEGFRAVGIHKDSIDGPDGTLDSYRFVFTIPLDDRLPETPEEVCEGCGQELQGNSDDLRK